MNFLKTIITTSLYDVMRDETGCGIVGKIVNTLSLYGKSNLKSSVVCNHFLYYLRQVNTIYTLTELDQI